MKPKVLSVGTAKVKRSFPKVSFDGNSFILRISDVIEGTDRYEESKAMQIIIDDTEVDIDLPDREVTLRDVIEEVETFLFEVGKVPIALNINGTDLSQEDLIARETENLSGDERLKFGVVSVFDFITNNLDGAHAANGELVERIRAFAQEVGEARTPTEGKDLVLELNHFCDFWYRLNHLLPGEFAKLDIEGKKFEEFFTGLSKLFEEIVQALQDKDLVLASDLFQYEIIPAVELIDGIIPTVKERVAALAAKDEESNSNPTET